jgi:NDP-sugar pyrophosphorylase family protein
MKKELLGIQSNMSNYKVLLTASGLGTRLGNLTKFTNKSLVRVGNKPAISYIIESYPKDIEIVVTLGHFGNHVKEYLTMNFSDRLFTFVTVDNYQGEGSSLGYSMLCAKNYLQTPFILHVCDTIVLDKNYIIPDKNWCAGFKYTKSEKYRSFNVGAHKVIKFNEKGEKHFDLIYIGLCGIKDYECFWKTLEELYNNNPKFSELSDVHVLSKMVKEKEVDYVEIKEWLDIGNSESLNVAKKQFENSYSILDKDEESIFFQDGKVIKFFNDSDIIHKRVERVKRLGDVVPSILQSSEHFYSYKLIEGELFARTVNEISFKKFLIWCKNNLWKKSITNISNDCKSFYLDKTIKRIKLFKDKNNITESEKTINEIKVPKIEDILKLVNFNWLCDNESVLFHGDLILDNVIETSDGFKLIDWRQDFNGRTDIGDIYYDLAKLNHNLTFNHDMIKKGQFKIQTDDDKVICDISISYNLLQCKEILRKFIIEEGYELYKVNLLTAIIWLNMSPLHEYPIDMFLFYFGKLNLWKNI